MVLTPIYLSHSALNGSGASAKLCVLLTCLALCQARGQACPDFVAQWHIHRDGVPVRLLPLCQSSFLEPFTTGPSSLLSGWGLHPRGHQDV